MSFQSFSRNVADRNTSDEGFSLIELLVVIIIIGVLAGIAIPVFLNQRQKGYDTQAKSDIRNMATAEETYLTDNPSNYTSSVSDLTALGFKTSINTSNPVAIAHSNTSYCLSEKGQSGTTWYYSSTTSTVSTVACS